MIKDNKELTKKLQLLKEEDFKHFTLKLIPNLEAKQLIGVSLVKLRKLKLSETLKKQLLKTLSFNYHELYLLKILVINQLNSIDLIFKYLDESLAYFFCWQQIDLIKPKLFYENREALKSYLLNKLSVNHTYTLRCVIVLTLYFCMGMYFDATLFIKTLNINNNDYYVLLAKAWLVTEALIQNRKETVEFLKSIKLEPKLKSLIITKYNQSKRKDPKLIEVLKQI